MAERALALLEGLPPALLYVVLGLGAAIENVIPVLPADTVIVAGGFAAGLGSLHPVGVFVATWALNVAGAVAVYVVGYRYGVRFFTEGVGRRFLSMDQLGRVHRFYDRWGIPAIFFARFLPGLRALVPVFAGVSRQHPARVLPPLILASAIWYGGLVRLGYLTGENLDQVLATLARANQLFLIVSVVLAAVVVAFWIRTRNGRAAARRLDPGEEDGDP
jgi:membrane protein DedA with SNARE-associated domain